MDELDHKTFEEYMSEAERNDITVTVCPPQKTPRWARQHTAKAHGTRIGKGCYMRGIKRA